MIRFQDYLKESNTTLQYHDELNNKFWDGFKLDQKVRKKLIEIANFWQEFANIPDKAMRDILLVGGNANYNYTKYSDLDVHLLVDKKKIAECDKDLIDDYLKDKKSLWSLTHDIKVYGFPVELYAQDINEKASKDQGVYSLKNNKWIRKPVFTKINLDDPQITKKSKNLMHHIDFFITNKVDDLKILDGFKEKLRDMRSSGIEKGGEFSLENLVFKELRNLGYLDKFTDYITKLEDKSLSMEKKNDRRKN